MEFITLREGLKVRVKDISCIEDTIKEDLAQNHETLIIMSNGKEYITFWPFETIMQILEMQDPEPIQTVKLEDDVTDSLINRDRFAG